MVSMLCMTYAQDACAAGKPFDPVTRLTFRQANEEQAGKDNSTNDVPDTVGNTSSGYLETKSEGFEAAQQTAPAGTPVQKARHSHHLRNVLIIVVLGAVLLVALAAAAK